MTIVPTSAFLCTVCLKWQYLHAFHTSCSVLLTLSYFKLQFRMICVLYINRCQLFLAWWKLVIPCHSDRVGKILKCGVCHQSTNWCSVELVIELPNSCNELYEEHQMRFNPSSSQYASEYYAQECFNSCVVKVKQRKGTASLQARDLNVMKPEEKRSRLCCRYNSKREVFLPVVSYYNLFFFLSSWPLFISYYGFLALAPALYFLPLSSIQVPSISS